MSNEEIDREQEYLSVLYGRLDDLRDQASARLAGVLRQVGGTPQARTERDAFSATYRQRLAQLDAAGHGLCFGRLEFNDGELRYVGRIGIHADSDDYEQLLMDWRADAARPFSGEARCAVGQPRGTALEQAWIAPEALRCAAAGRRQPGLFHEVAVST